jgi:hypothetical protein
MKKHFMRIATAVMGLAAFAVGAKAQGSDQLIVNVPYEFVVSGNTLPSGTYRLSRLSGSNLNELILSNLDNAAGAFVLSTEWEQASADKPGFIFQEIGGQHFLSKIATADHVFTVPVSKQALLEAARKPSQGSSRSAASGAR